MTGASPLIGHDAAWREWREALSGTRMHHAWIIHGPRGVGKGLFARRAALAAIGAAAHHDEDAFHPDVIVLDHLPANDEEERKRADGKPFQLKRNITIDQIRQVQHRLTMRPTLGDRRAVIIDPADDLERGAINCLLKSLEEPPAGTMFLLVSHRPGRLLATVRSRCRMLGIAPLDDAALDGLLQREAPEASAETRAAAIAVAGGSPGVALGFIEQDLGPMHRLMMRIVTEGDASFALRGQLAEEIGTRPARERQLAALDLARSTLAGLIHDVPPARHGPIIEGYAALNRLVGLVPTYNFDPGLLIMQIGGLLASAAMPSR